MNNTCETVLSNFFDATHVENYRFRKDGTLVKRNGSVCISEFSKPIRAMLYDTNERIYLISGDILYYIANGQQSLLLWLEKCNFSDDSEKCLMFIYSGILYIIGGGAVYTFDIENMLFRANQGHVSRISASEEESPAESFNLMGQRVRECFTMTVYHSYELKSEPVEIFSVTVGEKVLDTSDYTIGYDSNGRCIITILDDYDVILGYTLAVEYSVSDAFLAQERKNFLSSKGSYIFKGDDADYILLYGNEEGCIYYSKPKAEGMLDYFPADYKLVIGGGLGRVRAITEFGGRTLVVTQDTVYTLVQTDVKDSYGTHHKGFRAVQLCTELGITENSGVQIFEGSMYFLNPLGLHRLYYNSTEDSFSRSRIDIPENINISARELSGAVLHIDRFYREIWCIFADRIAVYSFSTKKWYYFSGFAPENCTVIDSHTVFSQGGDVCRFDEAADDDCGRGFDATFQLENIDFGNVFAKKTIYGFGVSLERREGAVLDCTFISDKGDSYSFSVATDEDRGDATPVIKRTHARLSHCAYITCRITSPGDAAPANVKELLFRYRVIE